MNQLLAREIMTTPVITVSPQTPVRDAACLLVERHISGLPVVDSEGNLVGIVTEADLPTRRPRRNRASRCGGGSGDPCGWSVWSVPTARRRGARSAR